MARRRLCSSACTGRLSIIQCQHTAGDQPAIAVSQWWSARSYLDANLEYWHTIAISEPQADSLHVVEMGRYARAHSIEDRIDTQLMDRYLRTVIADTRYDRNAATGPARTLFEQLLPTYVKESSPNVERIRLVLDKGAARYPWEMMIDGWADQPRPLAITKKLVRQLKTSSARVQIRRSNNATALVVGDPPAGPCYPRLPAARNEARLVASLLAHATGK